MRTDNNKNELKKTRDFIAQFRDIKNNYLDILGIFSRVYSFKGPNFVQIDLIGASKADCFNPGSANEKPSNIVSIPYEKIIALIDSLKNMGTKEIYLAGDGEPFLYPRILEIIGHIKKKGLVCYIKTDLTLIDAKIINELIRLKVDYLIIGLWAGSPQMYKVEHPDKDWATFCRIKQTLKFLAQIKEKHPYTCITNVISKLNYKDIDNMLNFSLEVKANGIKFMLLDIIPGVTDGLLLNQAQRDEVLESIKRMRNNKEIIKRIDLCGIDVFIKRLSNPLSDKGYYDKGIIDNIPCYSGWLVSRILSNGDVNACIKSRRIPVGNILKDDFRDIWNSLSQQEFRINKFMDNKKIPCLRLASNNFNVKDIGCYKGCDDIERSILLNKKINSLSWLEKNILSTISKTIAKFKYNIPAGSIENKHNKSDIELQPDKGITQVNIYGFTQQMHNAAPERGSDYSQTEEKIRSLLRLGQNLKLNIVVTKYNFLVLNEMIIFCRNLMGKETQWPKREFIPRIDKNNLLDSFNRYIQVLNEDIRNYGLEIRFNNPEVENILKSMESVLSFEKIEKLIPILRDMVCKERCVGDWLRILSIIMNKNFIGPGNLIVDILHRCNLNCLHCWIHAPGIEHSAEFTAMMTKFDSFKKIIDQAENLGIIAITLHADGEPLLHPDFVKMVRYVKMTNPMIGVVTSTNGILLNKSIAEELVELNMDEIYCSITGGTPEVFAKVCPGIGEENFHRLKTNLCYLTKLKKQYRPGQAEMAERPILNTAFVLQNRNYEDMINMAKFAAEVGADKLRFQLIHLDKNNSHLKLNTEQIKFIKENYYEVEEIARQHNMELVPSLKFQLANIDIESGDWSKNVYIGKGCFIGWFFSAVKANGDVSLCCAMKIIDNLKKKGFDFTGVWNSPTYSSYRLAAKNLNSHKNIKFKDSLYHTDREPRGDFLYSERCEHCDNHDHNNHALRLIEENGLAEFL
ncbi:MAG: radical SAM protein [Candidatus Omnitrophica bacterium]|nr:radical SAM protein [Candidatus Omnitrophota bacterium]MBU4468532.1 radical SAM protein [Candidatus Omnitrophota bacterium]MCG2707994.1 radical SAM protein [Candidatus Omnitrophota bacterium]